MKTLIKIQVLCLVFLSSLSFSYAQAFNIYVSPNSVVTCGDVAPRTVWTDFVPPSSGSVAYEWSVGGGWSNITGTITTYSSTLVLVPRTNFPSQVFISMRPIINGVPSGNYAHIAVLGNSGIHDATIVGSDELCGGAQAYSVGNVYGTATVTWSVSDPTKVSLSGTTGHNVTLTKMANGPFNLIATITNSCGETAVKTIAINAPKPLVSYARIIGTSTICSGSMTYSMNGLQSNETLTWSVSDPTKATISGAIGNQITVHKIGDGNVDLIGTITNACGHTAIKKLTIGLGVPIVTKPNCGGFSVIIPIDQLPADRSECDMCRSWHYYLTENVIEAEATGGHNLTWEWQKITNNFSWSTSQRRAHFLPYQNGTIQFRVRAGNTCGMSAWKNQSITITQDCSNDNGFDQNFRMAGESSITTENSLALEAVGNYFSAYPNPASTVINVELADLSNQPNKEAVVAVEMYDIYGSLKLRRAVQNNKTQINVSEFAKGAYVLKITIDSKVETHKIMVQ